MDNGDDLLLKYFPRIGPNHNRCPAMALDPA